MESKYSLNKRLRKKIIHFPPKSYVSSLFLLLFLISPKPVFSADSPSLDMLMGVQGRMEHQEKISRLVLEEGKAYSWDDFSGWGREIFFNGYVKNPPTGPNPSKPVSNKFKCVVCHNYEREDPDLSVQDPEARFDWIENTGAEVFLLQGVTVAGVVNQETFYADDFAKYHNLCVPKDDGPVWLPCGPIFGICRPGCRTMDPNSLEDAVQVCSNYCSVGRYLERWELYSLLAFFWDKEIKLEDLDLSPGQATKVKEVLTLPSPEPEEAKKLRNLLSSKYSKKAGNTYRGIPRVVKGTSEVILFLEYTDGSRFTGDPDRGERVFKLSCGRCHDRKDRPFTTENAKQFTENLEKFHKMIAEGTRSSYKRYMPNFTLERLSRQQAADILMYLQEFSK